MKYEYNGNLLEEDRIKLVAKEITAKYPQISIENARKVAMLEGKVSGPKTIKDELNRLYNIMLINSEDKQIVKTVYQDFMNIIIKNYYNDGIIKYIDIAEDIQQYLQTEFPLISEYHF